MVRHPIYLGLIVLAIVRASTSGNAATVVTAVALIGLLAWKTRWEEQRLLEHFPGYAEYARRVGRLLPGIGRIS